MKAAIIKLGALGDVIMATPIITAIAVEHSGHELFLVTRPEYTDLFLNWPGLTVVPYSRKGIFATLRLLHWIRSQKFERVYDLQSSDRSRLLCCLSAARQKVGNHNHFPYTHHPGDRYTGQNHIFERHKQVLASVGISVTNGQPGLPVPDNALSRVRHWLDEHNLTGSKLVLMHAGASPLRPQKRWPHFAALADRFTSSGYRVVWLGAAADAELNHELALTTGTDATNVFSIVELIALGQQARLAITNDSGPMHVLSCSGIPVYALYGPTDWRRHHALGQQDRVISLDRSNALWSASEYTDKNRHDLGLISAEMVWSLLLKENQISP